MRDDEFYNSNMGRSFPFLSTAGSNVPDWLIVDFRAIMLNGDFDPTKHVVYMAWMTRLAGVVRFGFRTDAPELSDQELIFEFDLNNEEMVTQHVFSVPITTTLEERCGCQAELLCDPNFQLPGDCGAEMLCNPNMEAPCGSQLLDLCPP